MTAISDLRRFIQPSEPCRAACSVGSEAGQKGENTAFSRKNKDNQTASGC